MIEMTDTIEYVAKASDNWNDKNLLFFIGVWGKRFCLYCKFEESGVDHSYHHPLVYAESVEELQIWADLHGFRPTLRIKHDIV